MLFNSLLIILFIVLGAVAFGIAKNFTPLNVVPDNSTDQDPSSETLSSKSIQALWAQLRSLVHTKEQFASLAIDGEWLKHFDLSEVESNLVNNIVHFDNLFARSIPDRAIAESRANIYVWYDSFTFKLNLLSFVSVLSSALGIYWYVMASVFNGKIKFIYDLGLGLIFICCVIWFIILIIKGSHQLCHFIEDLSSVDKDLNVDLEKLLVNLLNYDVTAYTSLSQKTDGPFLSFDDDLWNTQNLLSLWHLMVNANISADLDEKESWQNNFQTLLLNNVYDAELVAQLKIVVDELSNPQLMVLCKERPNDVNARSIITHITETLTNLNTRLTKVIHKGLILSQQHVDSLKLKFIQSGDTSQMDAAMLAKYYADLSKQISKGGDI